MGSPVQGYLRPCAADLADLADLAGHLMVAGDDALIN